MIYGLIHYEGAVVAPKNHHLDLALLEIVFLRLILDSDHQVVEGEVVRL